MKNRKASSSNGKKSKAQDALRSAKAQHSTKPGAVCKKCGVFHAGWALYRGVCATCRGTVDMLKEGRSLMRNSTIEEIDGMKDLSDQQKAMLLYTRELVRNGAL